MKLVDSLKYLAEFYGWNADDKREVWDLTLANKDMQMWWMRLANAHKAGYRQNRENGYMRLNVWEQQSTCNR